MHRRCIDPCMVLGKVVPSFTVRGGRKGKTAQRGQRLRSMRRGGHRLKVWARVQVRGGLTCVSHALTSGTVLTLEGLPSQGWPLPTDSEQVSTERACQPMQSPAPSTSFIGLLHSGPPSSVLTNPGLGLRGLRQPFATHLLKLFKLANPPPVVCPLPIPSCGNHYKGARSSLRLPTNQTWCFPNGPAWQDL